MKIMHVISSIDISSGGPARSVTYLLNRLSKIKPSLEIELRTLESDNPIVKVGERANYKIFFDKHDFLGYSRGLENELKESNIDLFHGQGIWDLSIHQMSSRSLKRGIPYVLTPRGMLEPWSLTQRKLKKRLAMKLYQKKDLEKASCIHATAKIEAQNIRALGFTNPIAVIPNGINIDDFPLYTKPIKEKRKLLFLSRIHPKKGIELLIKAWNELDAKYTKNWEVEIIGNGDPTYIESLKKLIIEKGLKERILILPPVFGNEKVEVYQNADLFVLPTYSENFGIVVAEALACQVPVITTKGTPWEDLNSYNCGQWIDIGVEPLKKSLKVMLVKSNKELETMGNQGRNLVENKYSMVAVAKEMYLLYQWLLNNTKKPKFVDVI